MINLISDLLDFINSAILTASSIRWFSSNELTGSSIKIYSNSSNWLVSRFAGSGSFNVSTTSFIKLKNTHQIRQLSSPLEILILSILLSSPRSNEKVISLKSSLKDGVSLSFV